MSCQNTDWLYCFCPAGWLLYLSWQTIQGETRYSNKKFHIQCPLCICANCAAFPHSSRVQYFSFLEASMSLWHAVFCYSTCFFLLMGWQCVLSAVLLWVYFKASHSLAASQLYSATPHTNSHKTPFFVSLLSACIQSNPIRKQQNHTHTLTHTQLMCQHWAHKQVKYRKTASHYRYFCLTTDSISWLQSAKITLLVRFF